MEPHSVPHSIGPYQIVGELGRGGMGVVYRARHAETGQAAAVKTVHLLQPSFLGRIRREIYALARVRHPGIVRIFEEGEQAGLPWYAMELVEGVTLRRYRDERFPSQPTPQTEPWWTQTLEAATAVQQPWPEAPRPEPGLVPAPVPASPRSAGDGSGSSLPAVLSLVQQLCGALAFLHGEGIVHRDLKPDNVLVRPDGTPVLMDFGLASWFGGEVSREELEIEGTLSGTINYMAPEQIRGELVDARADLYALGCILHELLTGKPPFHGLRPGEILQAHLQIQPRPPSATGEGIPPDLDALVLRLLAKDRKQRMGYAADVAAALAGLGAGAQVAIELPRPRSYLYRPDFAGRLEVLRHLRSLLDGLERGGGGLALIGGESGAGKTRLLLEAGREAQFRRLCVLSGEAVPGAAGGGPLHLMKKPLQEIADRCRGGGRAETERLLGRRWCLLAPYEPALLGLPGQVEAQDFAPLPAAAARLRLFGALAETLSALAADRPLLLLLDDLHWADELSLGFLEYLLRTGARASGRAPLQVAGTYTYWPEDGGAPGSAGLQRLIDAPEAVRIRLGGLDDAAVGDMVGDMLAMSPPPGLFVRFLSRESEGNPFFVAEYLRTAVAAGLLFRDPDGRWQVAEPEEGKATAATYEALPLPRSLQALVVQRLDNLGPEARRLVDAAAVLGRESDAPMLAEVAGLRETEAMKGTLELLDRQVMEQAAAAHLRFLQDKVRELAYERLSAVRRRELHQAAAQSLESLELPSRDELLAPLGHHWEQAADPERARGYYLAGARAAVSRHALEEAERLYRAFLRLVEQPGPESLAARDELAMEVLRISGRNPEALAEQEAALQEARRLGDRRAEVQALTGCGVIFLETGQAGESRARSEEALALAREIGDSRSEGRILGNLAIVFQGQGQIEQARACYEQALALHRQVGSRRSEGIALGNLAKLRHDHGETEESRGLYEQALAIHREVGNRRGEVYTLSNLGALHAAHSSMEQGLGLYEQALALLRQIGERRLEGHTLMNLADLYLTLGREEQAHTSLDQALAIAHEIGDRRLEVSTLIETAALRRRCDGDIPEARRLIQAAETVSRLLDDPLEAAFCLCERGHIELALGSSSSLLLQEAEAIAARLGLRPESDLARTVARLGRAQAAFEEGRALVRGDSVEDRPESLRR